MKEKWRKNSKNYQKKPQKIVATIQTFWLPSISNASLTVLLEYTLIWMSLTYLDWKAAGTSDLFRPSSQGGKAVLVFSPDSLVGPSASTILLPYYCSKSSLKRITKKNCLLHSPGFFCKLRLRERQTVLLRQTFAAPHETCIYPSSRATTVRTVFPRGGARLEPDGVPQDGLIGVVRFADLSYPSKIPQYPV